jgi:Nucleotidyl transferase AbiEii toxin, Type IV TA system
VCEKNVGDPILLSPTVVSVPRLMGGDPIRLKGYPLHMVHAEKIFTAVQRGVANTRWRDFGDIWTLSRSRALSGADPQGAIRGVARYRRADVIALRRP